MLEVLTSTALAGFGIHLTLIEPGGFSPDWAGPSARQTVPLDIA